MTRVTKMESDEIDDDDYKPRPKVGRLPVTLRLLNESESQETDQDWQQSAAASRKSDTQFMLLLVTLFAIVNLTLITLLNQKDKQTATAKTEPATTVAQHVEPLAPLPATQEPAPVFATVPAKQQTPPAIPAPAVPASSAYVTPASADSTKTTSAPFHPVSVADHAAPQNMAPSAGTTAVTPEAAKQDLLSVLNKD